MTPPGALPQSISVKFTKEERKDLLVRAEQSLLKGQRRLALASTRTGVGQVLTILLKKIIHG
jgi:hypothetical protein